MSSPGDAETIPALLALRRRTEPDRPALVTEDAAVTYLELDDASADLAARLVGDGVAKGDRVALL
ncbi:MAG: AMP-binding protein, partial [Acidimicrobiales bacterium]